jgi:hypothetical protein
MSNWKASSQIPGGVTGIIADPNGKIWAIGKNGVPNVYLWTGSAWQRLSGGVTSVATSLAVTAQETVAVGMDKPVGQPHFIATADLLKSAKWQDAPQIPGGIISIAAAQITPISLDLPAGFMAEPGQFERISVGSKDGEIQAWAIGESGRLHWYNQYAGSPYQIPSLEPVNPWERNELKDDTNQVIPYLVDVSVSSYGDMVAIRGDDKTAIIYDWTKKTWSKLPASNATTIKLKQIVAANAKNIYAVSDHSEIYSYSGSAWTKLSDGVYVAAGISTANKVIVIGLSDNGSAYELVGTEWTALKPSSTNAPNNLIEVAIGNEKSIYGIGSDGLLWLLNYTTKTWAPVLGKDKNQASGFASISVNSAGSIVALDGDGDNYILEATPAAAPVAKTTAKTTTVKKETRSQAVKAGKTKAKTVTKKTTKKTAKAKTAEKKAIEKKKTKTTAKKPETAAAKAKKEEAAAKAKKEETAAKTKAATNKA